jgi:hypothetical protein
MGPRPDSDQSEPHLAWSQMDPDVFITIVFASFVFVAGIVALILMRLIAVRSRTEGPYEQEEPGATTAQTPRRSAQLTPGRSDARGLRDASRRSRART